MILCSNNEKDDHYCGDTEGTVARDTEGTVARDTDKTVPNFSEDLTQKSLFANESTSWQLPDIIEGLFPPTEVTMVVPEELESLISYDRDSNTLAQRAV